MNTTLQHLYSDRGSLTVVETVITMSFGLLFAVGAYIFQQHSAGITSHDQCVMQKIAEVNEKGQPTYNLTDPELLSKINIKCPEGGQ